MSHLLFYNNIYKLLIYNINMLHISIIIL